MTALPELGDDEVLVPDPVTERPPKDRFCDLVLTGGVASGVVYPWAIVELARHFNFKNIGGTSVGAMAAALAAAAEYGRRCSAPNAFEALRRLPGSLAEDAGGGRARLLALFQPSARCERLFAIFVDGVRVFGGRNRAGPAAVLRFAAASAWRFRREMGLAVAALLAVLVVCTSVAGLVVPLAAAAAGFPFAQVLAVALVLGLGLLPLAALVGLGLGLRGDLRHGLVKQDLGLVRGGPLSGHGKEDPGLVAWLHEGIQRSAGMNPDNPAHAPLSFRDLWRAPPYPGADVADMGGVPPDDPRQRSIRLQMITTNVTHGRPYRLPLEDTTSALYYRPEELKKFFPPAVMQALARVARPYQPKSASDPPADQGLGLFELPGADLPIVVAARLSLSFPLLFAALPLHAVDYEMPQGRRKLKPCRFSDGGLCSNFPIHLFDAAVPRWPTFGMWLDKRTEFFPGSRLWLPETHRNGRSDTWQRIEADDPTSLSRLWRFLLGAGLASKDWNDRSAMRMPTVRNRVARINLLRGQGELNIAMSRQEILRVAHTYGVATGREFVKRFVNNGDAWRDHQWVRLHTLVESLRGFLTGVDEASRNTAFSQPLESLIDACTNGHAQQGSYRPPDGLLTKSQALQLKRLLNAVRALEDELSASNAPLPYKAKPKPELRVRPPL